MTMQMPYYNDMRARSVADEMGNAIVCRDDDDLKTKLDEIASLSSLTEDTPGVLMIAPGSYSLSSDYYITTDYVHVVSLTGQCDVKLEGGNIRWDNGKGHDDEDYDSCASGLMSGIDVSGTDDGFIWFPHNEPDVAFRNNRGGNWPTSGDFIGRTNASDFKYNEELGGYFCFECNQSGTVSHNGSIGEDFCLFATQSGTVSHNGSIGNDFCYSSENSGTVSYNGSIDVGFCESGENSGTASHNTHEDTVQDLIDHLDTGGVLSNLTCSDGAITYEEG